MLNMLWFALLLALAPRAAPFVIEGKVATPPDTSTDWLTQARVLVDGGRHLGFLRADGAFEVQQVASGSYVVEVLHPVFLFEPMRVDVSAKGNVRARKLNHLQPSFVKTLAYPLRFSALGKAAYFQVREQLRTSDLLLNPTVLLMVAPMLLIMVMPKLLNTQDPEIQKEMQQQMKIINAKQSMPDVSEFLSSWLGGGVKRGSGAGARKALKKK